MDRRCLDGQVALVTGAGRGLGRAFADLLARADVMVCPTTLASFGITLLEGMAAGLPIVASDIEGFREVLTDEREGLLVDTADPARLARAIATLLDDPARRARMAAEGRVTAARYDWPVVTRRVLAVYEDLLGAARPRLDDRG